MSAYKMCFMYFFFFSSRRRHTSSFVDWSSDVCSSDLRKYGAALGYFETTGSSDALLYPASVPVVGFANGSPNSNGWTGELDWIPYENTKLALQYTKYNQFNGGSSNYD